LRERKAISYWAQWAFSNIHGRTYALLGHGD
jgi:hypothetical protein